MTPLLPCWLKCKPSHHLTVQATELWTDFYYSFLKLYLQSSCVSKSHKKKILDKMPIMMITLTCVHTHEIQPYVPLKQVFQPWLPVAGPPLTPTPKQCSLVEPPQTQGCVCIVYCSCDLMTLPRLLFISLRVCLCRRSSKFLTSSITNVLHC